MIQTTTIIITTAMTTITTTTTMTIITTIAAYEYRTMQCSKAEFPSLADVLHLINGGPTHSNGQ